MSQPFTNPSGLPTRPTPQEVYRASFVGDVAMENLIREFENQSAGITIMEGLSGHPPNKLDLLLQNYGFTEIPLDDPSCYIEQTIHPIFRRENFDTELTVAGEAYEAMLPALALATKWITTEQFFGWWIHVLYGNEITLESGERFLSKSDREDDLPQARADLASHWEALSQRMTFFWAPLEIKGAGICKGTFTRNHWHALYGFEPSIYLALRGASAPFDPKIGLCSWYLYHLVSPVSRSTQKPCERMRLQFIIAKTIVHELSHAFYSARNPRQLEEPLVNSLDHIGEIGISWQNMQFGAPGLVMELGRGVIEPLYSETDSFCYAWPYMQAPVKTLWVEAWFRKSTWENIEELVASDAFKISCAVGRPTVFRAFRYVNKHWVICFYENGKARAILAPPGVKPSTPSSPPTEMCVEAWYKQIMPLEMKQAVEEGVNKENEFEGPFEAYIKDNKA